MGSVVAPNGADKRKGLTMNRARNTLRLTNRRGSIVLIVAASTVVLSGFGFFVLDAGSIYRLRRNAQTAADAGALSGGSEVMRAAAWRAEASARGAAGTNGFTHGVNDIAVVVSHPPITGYYVGDARFVEVVVTRRIPTMAMHLFGIDSVTIRARAVAGA